MVKVWVDVHFICVVEVKKGSPLIPSRSCLVLAECLESHSMLYIVNFEMKIYKNVFFNSRT